ncbi:MAG TPA: SgcJ/EcaC family oxidoreductase [Gemmatimonadaceae bacterium]
MRHRAASLLAAGGLVAIAACASRAGGYRATDSERAARRAEIESMLAHSAESWNRGDLDAFIDDYVASDATTYIGSRGVLRGPAAIRQAYAPRFAAGAIRDSLSFQLIDVDPVGPDALNVIATYILARRVGGRDSVTARGPTSLLMRRIDGRWRIAHDHSS